MKNRIAGWLHKEFQLAPEMMSVKLNPNQKKYKTHVIDTRSNFAVDIRFFSSDVQLTSSAELPSKVHPGPSSITCSRAATSFSSGRSNSPLEDEAIPRDGC